MIIREIKIFMTSQLLHRHSQNGVSKCMILACQTWMFFCQDASALLHYSRSVFPLNMARIFGPTPWMVKKKQHSPRENACFLLHVSHAFWTSSNTHFGPVPLEAEKMYFPRENSFFSMLPSGFRKFLGKSGNMHYWVHSTCIFETAIFACMLEHAFSHLEHACWVYGTLPGWEIINLFTLG